MHRGSRTRRPGLALVAHDADAATFVERLAQECEFANAADELWVVAVDVRGRLLRPIRAAQPLFDFNAQGLKPPRDMLIFKSALAFIVPSNDPDRLLRDQVAPLTLAQFDQPLGNTPFHAGAVKARQLDKINWGHAFAEALANGFVANVFLPFAAAVITGEVVWREHREEQARFTETLCDALLPIGHARNVVLVEEDMKPASGKR